MAKISIDQKNLALALVLALVLLYIDFWNLSSVGKGIILIVAIVLLLK